MDILNYLNGKQSTFLKSAVYEIGDARKRTKDSKLEFVDELEVNLIEDKGLEVIFTRKIAFNPDNAFKVVVSMGSYLNFDSEKIQSLDLKNTDFLKIVKDCPPIINKLICRSSLLISQMTSSFGNYPIITPPRFIEDKLEDEED